MSERSWYLFAGIILIVAERVARLVFDDLAKEAGGEE